MSDSAELIPAVILAGGLATRLKPLTANTPKALIDVGGRPFLWHQLQLLRRNGIRRVILLVGHLGEKIQERFGDGSDGGMPLEYSYDGPTLLGTGGSIRKALPLLPEAFFVLYGDSYLPCDYPAIEAAFRRSGRAALMTVYRNEGLYDSSNVEYEGTRIIRYDKRDRTPDMRHIDYGLGVFQRRVFEALPEGVPVDLATVYQDLLRHGELSAFEVRDRFYEIGSIEGLKETTQFIASRKPSPGPSARSETAPTVPVLAVGAVSDRAEGPGEGSLRRAVFLDRDGVLNEAVIRDGKPYPPPAAEFKITDGAAEALTRLKKAGFLLAVFTNQPDVARGTLSRDDVQDAERRLRAELPLDDVFTCFHDDADGCDCRKPRPGMIMQAAERYKIDLSLSYVTGDRWRDVDAGANAGCKTIWIDRGYTERAPSSTPNVRVTSLPEAVDWILKDMVESF